MVHDTRVGSGLPTHQTQHFFTSLDVVAVPLIPEALTDQTRPDQTRPDPTTTGTVRVRVRVRVRVPLVDGEAGD